MSLTRAPGALAILAVLAALSWPASAAAQDLPPLADCIATLRQALPAHPEVSPETFDTWTRDAQDLRPRVVAATAAQPEFQVPIWDYIDRRADAQRVADGQAVLARVAAALPAIERPGVDAATSVAVFGIETDYGHGADGTPVVDATLGRACLDLSSRDRQDQFFAALWLLQAHVVAPEDFRGSWAGAFGLTQFMPDTFVHYLRDRPEDPPADIVHSVPDALATTARFLRGMGWTPGVRWGLEARVPPALAASLAASGADHGCLSTASAAGSDGACRSVAQWAAAGVTRVDGSAPTTAPAGEPRLEGATRAALLMPAGPAGPAWLVTANYQAIWRYNRADAYALAIGLLSDALRGWAPQRAPWPTDDPGLSRAEFREVQSLLRGRGYCEMKVDGADGPITQATVRAEEARRHWPQTGRAGGKLLAALRDDHEEIAACPPAAPAAAPSAAVSSAVALPPRNAASGAGPAASGL